MTDKQFDAFDAALAEYPECAGHIITEARRARASEARLVEALKDAALHGAGEWRCWWFGPCLPEDPHPRCAKVNAAIQKAEEG